MHFRLLAGALVCAQALAAPSCPAPGQPAGPDSLGTLQTLKYNYLSAENNGTSAVLVYDRLSNSQARERCAAIGEGLFPFQTAPDANRTELVYQLDYLVYAKDLGPDDEVWVGGDCQAYSLRQRRAVSAPCNRPLAAICTSNVPPTRDIDRTVVASSKITVRSNDYTLTGYRDARSFRFLGVPFADPPVDQLRFAPPREYSGRKSIDATQLGSSCTQAVSAFGAQQSISEDCLYLNVFTPVLPNRAGTVRRPVAVYFYGGAFTSGTASMIDYDGGNFASRNDVVVVTVNYRVGALGLLATGNLTTGSYGIMDQIAALKWVNSNIAAFGGDPAHVTIFGQSAGGQSVIAVLSSTAARGLFSGALVQSAPVDLPWHTREVYTKLITPHIAEAVGCANTTGEASLVSCLRSVPATKFLGNSSEFSTALSAVAEDVSSNWLHVSSLLASIEPFMPVVDESGTGVIDDQFHTLLATNRLPNRVPTMFTTVSEEASIYVNRLIDNLGSTQSALNFLLEYAYPPELASALVNSSAFQTDLAQKDSVRITGGQALTASEWTCPLSHLLRNGGTASLPTLYNVEITDGHAQNNVTSSVPEICHPNPIYNATCHASDVLPAWGTLNSKTINVQPYHGVRDLHHSQYLNDVFGAFFRTYDPNPDAEMLRLRGPAYAATYRIFGEGGYRIEKHDTEEDTLASLGVPPSRAKNPGVTEGCAVFEDYGFTFENARFTE
ncbi:hypothetical protein ASPSYDRAFT_35628 [Aspergillus sydowii CBS 593.65]|uniref:Carboxylesterase type B domain-containing protein n=1 Tax=Aspergillus sydowii CBS 593.65 TaxID=1036612 RepID=A0A1L9T3V9_9EURO|nr:uncharacterized protein ASPSYDRAFT_35628 [Aspergillus sydowii CBS 593.65]OJJ54107.1 hypothetical protein ASPSYDRAFT_35628 [Aspergillus sydowii CBS 593.65]